jgi:hypothetical protein
MRLNILVESEGRGRWFCGGSVAVFWVLLGGLYVTTTALMPMLERLSASADFEMLVWLDELGWLRGLHGAAVPICAHLSLLGEGGKVVAE